MKTKLSPTLIGVFVLGALALLLVAVLAFGGASLFTKPKRFVVLFDESVQGLDIGAAVKVRGVRVGRVAEINVRYDAARHHSEVEVICEVSKNVLITPDGKRFDFSAPGALRTLVHGGLRAELGLVGLATGLLYVDLRFHEQAESPLPPDYPEEAPLPVVPAVPSAIAEFTGSVTELLAKLRQIDYAGIATELKTLLAAARGKVEGLELQPAVNEFRSASASVRGLFANPEVLAAFQNLSRTLDKVQTSLAQIDREVTPAGEDLRRALVEVRSAASEFGAASASVNRLVGPQGGLNDEALRTFQRVGDAADALQRFVDFLDRNPNALLLGRPPAAGTDTPKRK